MAKIFTNTRCVYCLRFFKKLNSNHVFPKSWYPDTTPENVRKIQVPACDECNQKFSKIENELLQKVEMCLDPNEQRGIPISQEKIRLLGEKFVRGITYDKHTKYIDSDHKVDVFFLHDEEIQPMVDNLMRLDTQDCNAPGIYILMVFANDDPQNGVFFIELWGQLSIYAQVLLREENTGEKVLQEPGVPIRITEQIETFCNEIDETQKPRYVSVKTESESKIDECFFNVKNKVEKDGGQIQFGWAIWEWPNVMIWVDFHAVWISPENEPIDISPVPEGTEKILFLRDSSSKYDYSSGYYRVPMRYFPLSDDPRVTELIAMKKEKFDIEQEHSIGREINVKGPARVRYEELKRKIPLLQAQLMCESKL